MWRTCRPHHEPCLLASHQGLPVHAPPMCPGRTRPSAIALALPVPPWRPTTTTPIATITATTDQIKTLTVAISHLINPADTILHTQKLKGSHRRRIDELCKARKGGVFLGGFGCLLRPTRLCPLCQATLTAPSVTAVGKSLVKKSRSVGELVRHRLMEACADTPHHRR